MQDIAWPPPYQIKRHRRARSVKLRAEHHRGLTITVPSRFNLREVPGILEENKRWILNQLSKLDLRPQATLPDSITLHSINHTWKIQYEFMDAIYKIIPSSVDVLLLMGDTSDPQRCRNVLLRWIKKMSKSYLANALQQISHETQLAFDRLIIRGQKTVWGSCTSQKTISLNYKLFFLPYHLLRYVLIHELCHTKYLNHSTTFWLLVEKFDPNYAVHRRELRDADRYIPSWVFTC